MKWSREDSAAAVRRCLADVRMWRDRARRAPLLPHGLVSIGAYVSWPASKCREAARQSLGSAKFFRAHALSTPRCGACGEVWPCTVYSSPESYRPGLVALHVCEGGPRP